MNEETKKCYKCKTPLLVPSWKLCQSCSDHGSVRGRPKKTKIESDRHTPEYKAIPGRTRIDEIRELAHREDTRYRSL